MQTDRRVLKISGNDRVTFLQNLVTNDVTAPGLVWTALLTPQGKYLVDFFVFAEDEALFVDVQASMADGLAQRLSMYKLRADVTITPTDRQVSCGLGKPTAGAYADPRHPAMGWRAYDGRPGDTDVDWAAIRIRLGIPESGVELIPNETYPLEVGFEALNGVDFSKGCYVGQEVMARMKHKTELRKGLRRVQLDGAADPGTEIKNSQDRPVGILHSRAGDSGLAYLRFDRIDDGMRADHATVSLTDTPE